MNWLFWAPLAAAGLHIFEEFVYPGGFTDWYRRYKPDRRATIATRYLAIVNVLLLIVCYDVGAIGDTPSGVALWLTVMTLLAANAVWHVVGTIRTSSYSPGLLTGLVLYSPLALYGYVRFLRSAQASIPTAIVACAVGASYQTWADAFNQWRGRGRTA